MVGYIVGIVAIIVCVIYIRKRNHTIGLYEEFMHAFPDMTFIVDHSLRIVKLYHIDPLCVDGDPEKMPGASIGEFFDTRLVKLIEKGVEESLQTGKVCESIYILSDRSDSKIYGIRIFSMTREKMACVFRDISLYKHRESAMQQSQVLLEAILDNIPIPIMLKDMNDHCRYIYWNRECDLQSGLNRNEVLGKTDIEIFGAERGRKYQEIDRQVAEEGKMYRNQEIYVTADGKSHASIVTKNLIANDFHRWLLVARWDITEQVEGQRQLEAAHRLNELILHNTLTGFVFVDRDYVVKWENLSHHAAHPLLKKYRPGTACYKSVKGFEKPCEQCVITLAFRSKKMEQAEWVLKDGTILEVMATPAWDKEGDLQGIVMRIEDVTAKRKAAMELQKAKEEAEKSNRLKTAFLANMSHEIRTPLNAIVGFGELLINTEDLEEKMQYIDLVKRNNEVLLSLINDILDLSILEAGSLELVYSEFDINGLLKELEKTFAAKVAGKEHLSVRFIPGLPECMIHGDRHRISQVLANLLDNAVKFTEQGQIVFGYKLQAEELYFYVEDTGIGIPGNKQEEIFRRFIKLDSFQPGTGLGLSICEMLVKKMNGKIGVSSQSGKGSTFWFTLPYLPGNR